MKKFEKKLTYANVVSTLALFLVLAGGAAYGASHLGKNSVGPRQLKKNSVTTPKIKDGAVTAAKLQVSSLGTVPSAANAGHATTAGTANALSAPEAVHYIGLPGEPGFEGSFRGVSGTPAGFFKDHECMVHFVGQIEGEGGPAAFTLPPAFRPAQPAWSAILAGGPSVAQLFIGIDGRVTPSYLGSGNILYFGLDSASFRATAC